ncbi:site-specific integrase [Methylobacterium sp. WL116]|uniref:site-specific integrase n=1 Tax=Methylobacterium sp. WL116 TaxID=2603889 RepID=UPI0011CC3300|nr:site-specific integrase [Methylobacterium sp. WL116]TXM95384.1 site-specific integrase [Methylobacterium sp. WL116]
MALAMATPWLHPRSGFYYLRRRVPDELKALVGSGEIRRSLGTRDPKEAKRLFPAALAALEEQWANLRDGPQALSERACIEMAVRIGEEFLAHHREAPSQQTQWSVDLGEDLFKQSATELDLTRPAVDLITEGFDRHAFKRAEMRTWCEDIADRYLAQNGLRVDAGSRSDFVWAIADATQAAALSLRELSQGARRAFVGRTATAPLPMTEIRSTRVPVVRAALDRAEQAAAISFETLITGWLRERQPSLKTAYVFPRTVREFIAFVGHDDAAAVGEDDLIRWKDALLGKELRGSTIRNGKIGPVRTILQWGVDNKKLSTNVARGIKVTTKARAQDRKRDPTEAEVAIILAAASAAEDSVRRWVPWLCAYSGARVAEICQLRKEDVYNDGDIHVLAIRPEAGSLKNENSERTIPVHLRLIEKGFLEFVEGAKSGPLFPDLPPDRFGSRGGNGSKVLSRWVRSLGMKDPRMQPNHGWRHRFSTLSRDHGLREDVTIYILGRQKTVSGAYGGYGLKMLLEQMSRIP